jgi:hypothetical protein
MAAPVSSTAGDPERSAQWREEKVACADAGAHPETVRKPLELRQCRMVPMAQPQPNLGAADRKNRGDFRRDRSTGFSTTKRAAGAPQIVARQNPKPKQNQPS